MEYITKQYGILTEKNIKETNIVTLSDLHWDYTLGIQDIYDIVSRLNDYFPEYIFILGDISTFDNLQEYNFKKKLLYFFKLLATISKTYVVLGNHDYLFNDKEKNLFVNINKLLDFYDRCNIKVLNNYYTSDDNFNIVGFNKSPKLYHDELNNISNLKLEVMELMKKIDKVLTHDKFNILLTHSHLGLLSLDKNILKPFDLVLSGHTHNGMVPNFLEKFIDQDKALYTGKEFFKPNMRGQIVNDHQIYVINGGITKISNSRSDILKSLSRFYPGEIDFVKIKSLK